MGQSERFRDGDFGDLRNDGDQSSLQEQQETDIAEKVLWDVELGRDAPIIIGDFEG